MAQPTDYDRVYNFQNFQTTAPTTPLPADQVDAEFNAIKQTSDETLNNLALIQRDDGELANLSVGRDQLAADLTVGFDAPVPWATATAYTLTSTVYINGLFYGCILAHTSGVFATDLAAAKWSLIADFNEITTLPGVRFTFSDSTDTSSEPADGTWRANNATLNNSTELAINNLSAESGNPDVSAFFARWAASTTSPKGQLYISKVGENEDRLELAVVDVIADTNFYRLTVDTGALTGAIADGDSCSIFFVQGHSIATANLMTIDFANASGTIPTSNVDASILNGLNEIGTPKWWPYATLPSANWLRANGETIGDVGSGADNEHAGYEPLFDLCQPETEFGNAGTEVWASGHTVNLPDMRGVLVAGRDTMAAAAAANTLQTSTTMQTDADTTIVVASATGIAAGMFVLGAGIPAATTVVSISGTTVTLSAAATTTAGPGTAVRFSVISDPDVLGATGGSALHTLLALQHGAHSHGVTDPGHLHTEEGLTTTEIASGSGNSGVASVDAQNTGSNTTGISIDNQGGDQPHPNVQPTMVGDWIILARRSALSSVTAIGLGDRLYKYSTATSDAEPGDGFLRFNNALLASATLIWLDDDDGEGTDISGALQAIGNSTSTVKGHLEVHNLTQAGKFARYTIGAAATDKTNYAEVTIAFEAGSGHTTFANNDQVAFIVTTKGDKGETGADGDLTAVTGAANRVGVFSSASNVTGDANFTWDGSQVDIVGALDITHTAAGADDHAFELIVDAAGFGDVKAIDIDYTTGTVAAGEEEAIILTNINQISATGGTIVGHEILATDGSADAIYGQKAGAGVGPILQDSGAFANPTTGTNDTVTTDVADMIDGSTGTNTSIFVADNDYIKIGAAAAFTEIEFIIETPVANPGIVPTFEYSTAGVEQWTAFTPIDGTNGFRNTGIVAWDAADLTGHVADDNTTTFDIRITRTHNSRGPVSLFYAKTAATVVYCWDKDGDLIVNSIAINGVAGATIDDVEVSTINADTTTALTLAIGDRGQTVTMTNGSANVLTVPANSAVAFPVGTVVNVIQGGAGVTTITGDTGVTVNGVSTGSGAINNRYQGVSLLKIATNTWIASGDIGTVA